MYYTGISMAGYRTLNSVTLTIMGQEVKLNSSDVFNHTVFGNEKIHF